MLTKLSHFLFALIMLLPKFVISNVISIDNSTEVNSPTITLNAGDSILWEAGTAYVDPGAIAEDVEDGPITDEIVISGTVNTDILGAYYIQYSVTDADNNTTTVTRTVTVQDTTSPEITLIGSAVVNVEAGTTYTEQGATAEDNFNGDISSSISIDNAVNTNTIGVYTVTYNVSDVSGNPAVEKTRTVNVVDTTRPVISLNGNPIVTQEVFSLYVDNGARALDSFEGDISSRIVTNNPVDDNVVDVYTITYDVSDNSSNAANQVTRTVNIVDTTSPVISLIGAPTLTIEAGTTYVDQGATASDNYDGEITENIVTVNTVDSNVLGTYTITYNVSDASGNPAVDKTRTVNVVDTAKPIITLLGDPTLTVEAGDVYVDAGAEASDNLDGNLTANIISNNPVDTGVPGTYLVTFDVTDSSGNIADTVVRTVNVVDSTNPVITLVGDNQIVVPFGGVYAEPGYETNDNSTTGVSVSINDNINTSITGAYAVIYSAEDTSGNTTSISRSVYVGPRADAGSDQILCLGDELRLGFSGANPSYNYTWSSSPAERTDGDPNFVSLSPPYAPLVSPDQATLFTLTVTTTIDGVVLEETDEVLITVAETPVAKVIENTEICLGESITIGAPAVAGSTYQWTSEPTGFSSTLANPTVTPSTNTIYYLTETKSSSSNCTATNAVEITVAPLAEVSAGPSDTICESEASIGYRLAQASSNMIPPNITFEWTALGGDGNFVADNELNPVYYPGPLDIQNGSVTLQLIGTPVGACSSTPDVSQMTLTIVPSLVASAGLSPVELCENSTYKLNGVAANYSSVSWSSSGTAGTLISANTLTPTYNPSANDVANGSVTLTMTVTPLAACSGSFTEDVVINLIPIPEAFAGSNKIICEGENVDLSDATWANGSSFTWTSTNSGTFVSSGANPGEVVYIPNSADIDSGGTILTLTVTGQNACGSETVTSDVPITIYKTPQVNPGPENQILCEGANTILGAQVDYAQSFQWSYAGDGVLTDANTLTPIYTPGPTDLVNGTVTLSLTATAFNGCSPDIVESLVFQINKAPEAFAGPDDTVCANTPYQLIDATANNYSKITWSTSGTGAFDSTASVTPIYTPSPGDVSAGFVELTMTVDQDGCSTIADSMELTIVQEATSFAGNDIVICQGENTSITTASATNYSSLLWEIIAGSGTLQNPTTLNPTYVPNPNETGNVQLRLTASPLTTDGGIINCGAAAQDNITISIVAAPIADVGSNQTICEGDNFSFVGSGVSAANYNQLIWTTSGDGSFSSPNSLEPTYIPGTSDRAIGQVTLRLEALANAPCSVSALSEMILSITQIPVVDAGPLAVDYCEDDAVVTLEDATAEYQDELLWVTSGSGTFSNASLLNPQYNPSNEDIVSGSVVLTLTGSQFSTNCGASTSDDITVNFIKLPQVSAGVNAEICDDNTYSLNDATATNFASITWTTSGTGTFSNTGIINPTYSPSLEDIALGVPVELTITAVGIGPCETVDSDTMELILAPSPIMELGNNRLLCEETSLVINLTEGVDVYNVDNNTYEWTTSGTGTFTPSNTLSTTYQPSPEDIAGGVPIVISLSAQAIAPCATPISDSFTLNIIGNPTVDAGPDAITICETGHTFTSAQATNYDNLQWVNVTGTGVIQNSTSLNATYVPSEADINAGTPITLRLTAYPSAPCSTEAEDEVVITITASPVAYAGDDSIICEGETFTLSTATAANYTSLQWSSLSGGTFANGTTLTPTYTPSTAEIAAGQAILELTLQPSNPCSAPVKDSMVLTIQNQPDVEAGNDTTICEGDTYQTNTATLAFANNAIWSSTGTGTFTNARELNTTYTPSVADINIGTVVLRLTADAIAPCIEPIFDELTLDISSKATVSIVPDTATICATDSYTFDASQIDDKNAISYLWTSSGDGTFSDITEETPTYTPGTVDIANNGATLTLSVYAAGPCVNPTAIDNFSLIIDPIPTIDLSGTETTVCFGSQLAINSAIANYDTITWSIVSGGGSIVSGANSLTPIYEPAIDSDTVRLSVTATGLDPCTLTVTDELVISVTQLPEITSFISDTVNCDISPFLISGVNTNGNQASVQWTTTGSGVFSNINVLNPTYTPSQADVSNGFVDLTMTALAANPCTSAENVSDTFRLTLNPAAEVFAGSDDTLCVDSEYVITDATETNTTSLQWSSNGTGTWTSQNSLNATYIPSDTDILNGFVILTITGTGVDNCPESTDSKRIDFIQTPVVDLVDAQTYCTDQQGITLSPAVLENSNSIQWTTSGSGIFSSNSVQTPTYYPSAQDFANGQVTITLTNYPLAPCLDSVSDTTVLTFAKAPEIEAGVDQTVCEDQNIALQATATNTNNLSWTTSGTGTFLGGVNNTLDPTYIPSTADVLAGSVEIKLTATGDSTCQEVNDTVIITFVQNPVINIGSDLTFCENIPVTFSDVSYTNVGSILWTTNGLGVLSNETTENPTYTPGFNETGVVDFNLTVQAIAPCSEEQTFTKSINFVAAPTANAGPDIQSCESDGAITLTGATASVGASVVWDVIVGGGVLTNNTTLTPTYTPTSQDYINGEVRIELRAIGTNGCADASDEMSILLTPTPIVSAGPDATICQDDSFTTSGASVAHSINYIWSTPNGSGTLVAAPNDLTAIYTPGANETGTIRLVLTAQAANGCTDVIVDERLLTINPPTTANAGLDQQLCAGDTVNLAGEVTNQSSFIWTTNGAGIFVPSATTIDAQYQPALSDYNDGNVTLTLTATGLEGCNTASDNLIVEFAPIPEVFAGNDAEICVGESYDLSDATVQFGQNTQWVAIDGDGVFVNPNSPNTTYIPGDQDVIDGSVTLRITSDGISPCTTSVNDEVVLTITPVPELNVTPNFDICEGTFTILGTTATNYDTISWQIVSGSGTLQFADQLKPIYTTGQNDLTNGTVLLSATITGTGSCNTYTVTENVTLSINPSGEVDAGADMISCVGNPYTFANGATFSDVENIRWEWDGTGSITAGQGTMTPTYTPSVGETGIVTFTLIADEISPCNSVVSDKVTLELIANPEANAGVDFTTCAGEVTLNGTVSNASSFAWSGGNGVFIPDNVSSLTAVYSPTTQELNQGSVTLVLTAQPINPCAAPATSTVTISFETPATVDAGPTSASVCSGDSFVLDFATVSNASNTSWSTTGSGVFNPSESSLNPVYIPSAADIAIGNVTLQLTADGNGNCATVSDEIALTIQPLPQVAILNSSMIFCDNQTSVNISGVTANDYDPLSLKWTTSGEGSFVNDAVLNPEYIPHANDYINGVTLYVQVTGPSATACSNAIVSDEIKISFTPSPEVYAGANAEICITEGFYTISDATKKVGTNIKWSTTGTGSFDNENILNATYTPSAVDIANGSVNLTIEGTSGQACSSVSDVLTLTLTKNPIITLSQNIFTVCTNEVEVPISGVTIQDEASINWSHDGQGNFKVSNTTPNQVYIPSGNDFDQGVTLTLTANGNGSCAVPAVRQITLNFTDEVTVSVGANQAAVCANENFQISNTTISNELRFEWTSPGGDGTFSETSTNINPIYSPGPNDISNGTVNLRITGYGRGNCADVYDEITLTIDPVVDVFAGDNISLCSSEVSYILSDAFATNEQAVSWSRADGNITGFTDTSVEQAQYFFSDDDKAAGFVTLVMRGFGDASCTTTVEDTVTITFVPDVELYAGDDASVCYGSAYTVEDASITPNSYDAISWSSSGTGVLLFDDTLNPQYTPSVGDLNLGQVTLTMTVTPKSECGANPVSDVMLLTIDESVTGTGVINGTQSVCEGETQVYTLTGLSGETNYNWVVPTGVTIVSGQGTDQIVASFNNFNQNTDLQLSVVASNDCLNSNKTSLLDVTVYADAELGLVSGSNLVSLCYNEELTPIMYETKGGTNDTSIQWFVSGSAVAAPAGIQFIENASTVEISGTLSASVSTDTTYTYEISATTLECSNTVTETGTLTLLTTPIVALETGSDDNQTLCEGSPIADIKYTFSNADDYTFRWVGTQPTGINANYNSATTTLTISGISQNVSQSTTFTYEITPENAISGCVGNAERGTITVNADGELTLNSSNPNQTVCEGDAITPVVFTLGGGATSAEITPTNPGDDISWMTLTLNGNIATLTGTPTNNISTTTDYAYTITSLGSGCQQASKSGVFSVIPKPRVELSPSSVGTLSQTACEGVAIDPITYDLLDIDSGSLVTVTNLPPGVSYSFSGSNSIIISGAPVGISSFTTYNYKIEVSSSSCVSTFTGSIQVHAQDEIVLNSIGADFGTYCFGESISPISYQFAGGTTGATIQWEEDGTPISSNPQGIAVIKNANNLTISGTYNANTNITKVFTYTITSSNPGSCAATIASGSLTFEPKPNLLIHSSSSQLNQQLCEGDPISNIVFEGSANVDVVQISWDKTPNGVTGQYNVGTRLFTISGTPQNIDSDTTYTYTVIAKDQSTGCTSELQTGAIQVFAAHTLSLVSSSSTTSQVLCEGEALPFDITYEFEDGATSATVSGLDGTGFSWVVNGNQLTISGVSTKDISSIDVINYTVSTTGNSCGSTSLAGNITVNPDTKMGLISAPGSSDQTLCEGQALIDIQYQITENFFDYVVSGLPNGVNHSLNPATNVVTISGTPSTNISSDVTYNYTIKALNAYNCIGAEFNGTLNITAGPEMTLIGSSSLLNQNICIDSEIQAISVRFSNGNTPTISNLPAGLATQVDADIFKITGSISQGGTYSFDISIRNSTCSTGLSIPVVIKVQPSFSILSQADAGYRENLSLNTGFSRVKHIACYGERTGEIKVEMDDSSNTYLYSWTGPYNYTNTTTSPLIKNLFPGTYTVNVSALQASDCSVSETFIVNEPDPLQMITNEIIPVSCDGVDDGVISLRVQGGNTDFYKQLSWFYFEEDSSCFTYEISLKDEDNDSIYDIVDADVDNDGILDAGKSDGNNDGIIDSADADLDSKIDSSYVLSNLSYQNCDSGQFINLNLVIDDFSSNGSLIVCARPNTVTSNDNLDHDDDPSTDLISAVDVFGGNTSCASGEWVAVSDLDGSSYGSGLKEGLHKVVLQEVEFSTGDTYCSIEKTFEVPKNEISFANLEVSESYCVESSGYIDIDVNATSENIYFYYDGNRIPDTDISILAETFAATRYRLNILNPIDGASLEIQDEFGCGVVVSSDLLDISVNNPDFIYTSPEFETYGTISERSSVSFTLDGINSYDRLEWDFGDASPLAYGVRVSHQYQAEGTYDVTLTVYNASGCFKSITKQVLVGKGYSLMMPNTFTPNNDNINDRIGPVFSGLKEVNFFVYNKSGVLIYQETVSEDSASSTGAIQVKGWDGSNADPNSNYYVYKIIATRINDEIVTDVGSIFLLK